MVIYLLAGIALMAVLVYVLTQRGDDTWDRFRQRKRERAQPAEPKQPINPVFQFDEPEPPKDAQPN